MPEASAISAYKIIREAIFNAIKHSKAAQVRVSIHHNKALDTYKVEITDDGVGMKATARNGEHAGIGLIDMRERVGAWRCAENTGGRSCQPEAAGNETQLFVFRAVVVMP
jgi:nitrate/nitrite-specific signal transduction histidine kinase